VELKAENIVGSYSHMEHEACIKSLPNEGHLKWVFEVAGIAYGPQLQPGTKASGDSLRNSPTMPSFHSLWQNQQFYLFL
jgi:hypothetical protein